MVREDSMADSHSESLGKRLRQERKRQHLTQEQLAKASKVSVSTIRRCENMRRKPQQDVLDQLAKTLGRPDEEWGDAGQIRRQIRWNMPLRGYCAHSCVNVR